MSQQRRGEQGGAQVPILEEIRGSNGDPQLKRTRGSDSLALVTPSSGCRGSRGDRPALAGVDQVEIAVTIDIDGRHLQPGPHGAGGKSFLSITLGAFRGVLGRLPRKIRVLTQAFFLGSKS